ncbi:MAG TPA: biotin transporter BioY [Anaerolineales bacterium]|nr:biotin transporter BioY [Anaerolineales bacterium]
MLGVTGQRAVLAERAWPGIGLARSAALVVGGALITALCSQIVIPVQPVPITGQTFAVLLVGALLGSRRGVASMLTYVAMGAVGLPVFAEGAAGLSRLAGPTGGYLAGFVVAAAVVGFLSRRGWDRRVGTTALAMALGTLVIYIFGIAWLSRFVGWGQVLVTGVIPFLVGDALKLALAALSLPWAWRLVGDRDQH